MAGELNSGLSSVALALGGTSSYNTTTGQVTAGLTVGGATYTSVQNALSAINGAATAGWNVTTAQTGTGTVSGSSVANVAPGSSVTYTAGDNIAITQNGAGISIATSLRPTFDEVTINGGPVLSSSGIANVANGAVNASSSDAVNGSQLYNAASSVAAALGGGSSVGANGSVSAPTYQVYGTDVTNVQGALTALQSRSPLQYANAAGIATPTTPSDSVTLVGSDTGPVIIHNLAPGVANADAVDVQQLNAAVAGVAAGVNPNAVSYSATTANTVVFSSPNSGGTKGAAVTLTNVAPGAISSTSTDAVNGAQLYATNQAIGNLSAFAQTVQKQAYAGTAVGLAAAGLRYDDRPGKISTAAAFGYYHGQTGFAGGIGATSSDGKWRLSAALSLTPGNGIQPDFGVSAGLSYTWN